MSNSKKYIKSQVEKIKDFLKNDETMQKIFAEHGIDIEWIDFIPMKFGRLDVSAKTDHGIVILNKNLLFKNDFKKMCSYALHEFVHYLQQCFGERGTQASDCGTYLDNPYEQEAFKNQVEFLADNKSEEYAENYVENLLEHHDVEEHDKKDKADMLMSQI